MKQKQNEKYKVKLSSNKTKICSDGISSLKIKCEIIKDDTKQRVKGDTKVTFSAPKNFFYKEKEMKNGFAEVEIKTRKPVGKIPIKVDTPYGSEKITITVVPTFWQNVWDYFYNFIIALIAALIFKTFIIGTYYIPSGSMEPTFYRGDRLFGNQFIYKFKAPKRGDIIIFKYPKEVKEHTLNFIFFKYKFYTGKNYVKRLIGVGGDEVEIKSGDVFINKKKLKETYIKEPAFFDYGPIKVPEGYFFVLGDNRNNSSDSRSWGFVKKEYVIAKPSLIFWPPWRIKIVK